MSGATVVAVRVRRTSVRTVYSLAINTFQESIRKKVLLVLLVFAAIALAAGFIYSSRSQSAEVRALIDSSVSSIRFIGVLMAIFLGATSIPTETERRTILTILAKPVTRGQFLLGKYFGILLTVWANVVLMSVLFIVLVIYKQPTHVFRPVMLKALLLVAFELAVVVAIATTLATFSTMTFTMICSFFIYFLGHVADGLRYLSDPAHGGKVGALIAGILYPILPHFENFDIRQAIMSTAAQAPLRDVLLTCGSGVLYSAIMLLLGYSIFKDREF